MVLGVDLELLSWPWTCEAVHGRSMHENIWPHSKIPQSSLDTRNSDCRLYDLDILRIGLPVPAYLEILVSKRARNMSQPAAVMLRSPF